MFNLQKLMGHYHTMDIIQEFLSKINSTKVLVIAGSMFEFERFVDLALYKHSQFDLYDGYEFVYYATERTIRGERFDHYFYYGTGVDRTDVDINYVKMTIKS